MNKELKHNIELIYADEQIVVVNKPSGLLSVPGRGPDKQDCVVSRLQQDFPTVRVVHRLDCATSGLMVLALDADSHRELSRQFHDREVNKRYEALVFGGMEDEQGEVDQPLMTDWPNRPRQMISEDGKAALTHYTCLSRSAEQSRVDLKPITGRSHQLRVHMLYTGHPILGDGLYAHDEALQASERLCLHARYLSVTHPVSRECLEFTSAVPF
jgi:tRNA pseudouridine32 synthase / 23S rRNA pseudouridine746 synthase